ncbi:Nn.00g004590.m01.CDS01 [Neocucurbitaria sp. VM-36]
MSLNDRPSTDISDNETVQTGKRFGYGNWLQPIINANDQSSSETAAQIQHIQTPASTRRGRGRPRVTKTRNESAIEKRRAQVREAQRAYQRRKDTATASEKQRVDELLQVFSDLSSCVEALLQASSKAGVMHRHDDVSKHIQHLWIAYNTAINDPSVTPELRLLQMKNGQRVSDHHSNENFINPAKSRETTNERPVTEALPLAVVPSTPFDPRDISFELVRFEETTVMQPFQRTTSVNGLMAGRSIFDVVKERQAAMKEADKAISGL